MLRFAIWWIFILPQQKWMSSLTSARTSNPLWTLFCTELYPTLLTSYEYIFNTNTHTHTHTHIRATLEESVGTLLSCIYFPHTETEWICTFKARVVHCLVMLMKLVGRYCVISPCLITLYKAQIEIRTVWRLLFSIWNRLLAISEINRHLLSRLIMPHQLYVVSQQHK
jgi:hypothetical protein